MEAKAQRITKYNFLGWLVRIEGGARWVNGIVVERHCNISYEIPFSSN